MAARSGDTDHGKRHCWVCFATEFDDSGPDDNWVSPCRCNGTMKWVHEECLQRWIDEKQHRTNNIHVSCSQCKACYILSYPPVNRLAHMIDEIDKLICVISPVAAVSAVACSIYCSCGTYGIIAVLQVMGYEEGRQLIEQSDPLVLAVGLPAIPIGLILAKLIRWEDYLLRIWREAYKIPRPLSYIIDSPPAIMRGNCDQILTDPGFQDPINCTRLVCGALLLPTLSALFGSLFFSKVSESQWRRTLLGGLTFLVCKGVMKIYLRKSLYVCYSQRKVKNFPPVNTVQATQTSSQQQSRANSISRSSDELTLTTSISTNNPAVGSSRSDIRTTDILDPATGRGMDVPFINEYLFSRSD